MSQYDDEMYNRDLLVMIEADRADLTKLIEAGRRANAHEALDEIKDREAELAGRTGRAPQETRDHRYIDRTIDQARAAEDSAA